MKKVLKLVGFISVIVLAMFLNTNAMDSNKSVEFNLADAIAMQSANAECPSWMPAYLCPDKPDYKDGYEESPYQVDCNTENAYITDSQGNLVPNPNHTPDLQDGIECIWVVVPGECTPVYPCVFT